MAEPKIYIDSSDKSHGIPKSIIAITYRPSNGSASESPEPDQVYILKSTPNASAYHSDFLDNFYKIRALPLGPEDYFQHLNCFHLTVPDECPGPTLNSLKQHAQALCLFIFTVDDMERKGKELPPEFPDSIDFLQDINIPFPDGGYSGIAEHQLPLPGLVNTLASANLGVDVRDYHGDGYWL